jgi:hypothetical protein
MSHNGFNGSKIACMPCAVVTGERRTQVLEYSQRCNLHNFIDIFFTVYQKLLSTFSEVCI